MGITFDKNPLAAEQNSYLTKIENANFFYDLEAWPNIPLITFTLKDCLCRAINIVKNSDKY